MAETKCYFMKLYNNFVTSQTDSRINDMLLMSSPLPTICLVALYLMLVKRCLPKFMEKRNPYELRKFNAMYRAIQCISSAILIYNATENGWLTDLTFFPKSEDSYTSSESLTILNISWYLFAVRFLDFFDTIILVLRKNSSEVSSYHIFQRAADPILLWFIVKLAPSGPYTFGSYLQVFANVLIHSNVLPKKNSNNLRLVLPLCIVLFLFTIENSLPNSLDNLFKSVLFIYNMALIILFVQDSSMFSLGEEGMKKTIINLATMCIPNQLELYDDNENDENKSE